MTREVRWSDVQGSTTAGALQRARDGGRDARPTCERARCATTVTAPGELTQAGASW